MQTVQDDNKFIVRTKNIAFYLCGTESSDSTHTKFDFTDPKYCTPCEKFDPENDELVKGEDQDIISESSQLTGFADDGDKEKEKDKENNKENQGTTETLSENHHTVKHTVMTRKHKLELLKDTFHDWLEYCDIQDKPIENIQLEVDGKTLVPEFNTEELKGRWNEARCELE